MDADVIVIGGGASGLFAGMIAGKRGRKVIILEQKEKIGKKILATGNGKCNYSNQTLDKGCYRGEDPIFAKKVLEQFDNRKTIETFRRLGIEPKNKNGYFYPASEQAVAVVEVLKQELLHNQVRIMTGVRVEGIYIKKTKVGQECFLIETKSNIMDKADPRSHNHQSYRTSSVILATGGYAYPALGSDGSGYGFAKSFGHRIITPLPALTSLKVKEKYIKALAGVRVESMVRLFVEGRNVAEDKGELQLVKYGISGIPVFQISRFASKALWEGKNVTCQLDFFPNTSKEELVKIIRYRANENDYKTIEGFLMGLIHNKLAYVVIKESKIPFNRIVSDLGEMEWNRMIGLMKGLSVTVTEPSGFDKAQVTAGGVCTDEIHVDSMESKIVKGLYITGELLDVDGICGGYNLQWAWSTGYLAGRKA